MKLRLPALHHQILIALLAGVVFGVIFNVDPNTLIIRSVVNKSEITTKLTGWEKLLLVSEGDTLSYAAEDRDKIIRKFGALKKSGDVDVISYSSETVKGTQDVQIIRSVISAAKEGSISTDIKFIGDIFIRLLNMIAIPLVLSSLIVGAASLGDIKKFARIGSRTLAFYLITTAIAVTIGLTLTNIIQPGKQLDPGTEQRLLSAFSDEGRERMSGEIEVNVVTMLVNMIPRNPFSAIAGGDMLQIVFFAIVVGMMLTMIPKEKSAPVTGFFDGLSDVMIKAVEMIMLIAPIGVFALIAATISEFGFNILQTLFWYSVTVLLGLLLHISIVYTTIVKIFTKTGIVNFFRSIRQVQSIGFSTSSSAATLPVNMETLQVNLGVSKSITSFVLPLGATINMDGTALYQGVAAVFIAQVFGVDLTLTQQFSIVLLATLASIGTAPVPGVGIIMLVVILKSLGIPEIGVALILGVDRILDMCRTVTNVTGDAAICTAVASAENEISPAKVTE
ncbi:MAG: dicarboxylate/amino acid:cation symporter [Ignavibacteriaceae bacterium]|nr:dicarboxylate/amino acid:cation symporter [Ignavibacteriaceae bacterium]